MGRDLSYIIGDQGAYLETATHLKNGEGFVSYGLDPYNPEKGFIYPENNRHPLYILVLSLFASEEPIFFFKAKTITLLISLFSLWCIFFLGKKMFGDLVAMAATLLLFTSGIFNYLSNTVGCEPLLLFFSLLGWYFIIKGFKQGGRYLVIGGAFSALAYLTKASAILIPIAFFISSILLYRKDVFKKRALLLYFVSFLLVSSPLILRNIMEFGDPFYNLNTTRLLWGGSKPLRYLMEHPVGEILEGLGSGLYFITLRLLLDLSISHDLIWKVLSFIIFIFFIISIDVDRDMERKVFSFSFCFLCYLSYGWYVNIMKGWGGRFFIPILPIIYLYSMEGLCSFLNGRVKRVLKGNPSNYIALLLILLTLFFSPITPPNLVPLSSLLNGSFIPLRCKAIIDWLKENTTKEEIICLGPDDRFMYNWITQRKIIEFPSSSDFEEYLSRHNVKYIIITRDTLKYRQEVLGRFFVWNEDFGLIQKKSIPNWELVSQNIPDSLIYRRW
jgi:hypothetical protein